VRSFREIWLWLGGLFLVLFAFLAAVAMSYFAKEPRYSLFGNPWMLGACLSFGVAFAAFFGAAKGWAFPPMVAAGFPKVTVEIKSIGSTDTEHESSSGLDVPVHLRSFHVRFTNTERERSADLTVLMYVKLVAGSWGRAGEALCPVPTWTLPSSLGLRALAMPFDLAPGNEISGQLVYEIPRYHLGKILSPISARLEIVDHVSGKRVTIPAELGLYDKSAMNPAPGGAEVLGAEFETPSPMPMDELGGPAIEEA
jgi:hypothetical protein